ncbi:MAG TPA: glycosyltransferase [Ktedonobacteraceae bacterium]|nr:glycosyltransferase [Ktedonobacteraceae bacterium]
MQKKHRLLAIGYAREGFGFGRVLQSLLRLLVHRYDIHQFEMTSTEETAWPWQVYRNQVRGDWFGTQQLPALVEKVQPDLILLAVEIWEIQRYVQLFQKYLGKTRLVAYTPIDGPLKTSHYLEPLGALARLVVPTHFALRELRQAFARECGMPIPHMEVIPHGVDTGAFYPYAAERARGRRQAREELFPARPELQQAFIVFNGNRNQFRKRIDLTMQGFRLFAEGKSEHVKLYLHMGVVDKGVNILGYARQYGILDRLLYTTPSKDHPVVDDTVLNRIYNACDVGLNTSMGEGWGLVSFEHAATGAAQVVPEHSACEELWQQAAIMLSAHPLDMEAALPFPVQMQEVRPEEIAASLELLYRNPQRLAELSLAALHNASRPELQWSSIAARFDDLFQEVLHEKIVVR